MAPKTSVDFVATQIAKMAEMGASEAEIDISDSKDSFEGSVPEETQRFRDRKSRQVTSMWISDSLTRFCKASSGIFR